jgi:hypothetical protein
MNHLAYSMIHKRWIFPCCYGGKYNYMHLAASQTRVPLERYFQNTLTHWKQIPMRKTNGQTDERLQLWQLLFFWKVTLDVARRALILFRVLSSKELDGYGPLLSCRNDKLLKFKLWKAKKDRYTHTHTHTLTYTYTQTEHSLTSVCTCTHRLQRCGLKSTTAMWKGDI